MMPLRRWSFQGERPAVGGRELVLEMPHPGSENGRYTGCKNCIHHVYSSLSPASAPPASSMLAAADINSYTKVKHEEGQVGDNG